MSDNLTDFMPFAKLMGVQMEQADKDLVRGKLEVRPEMCTMGNIAHGGALMAFADSLGAVAAFLNLPEGAAGTTTVESKTNFLGGAAEGTVLVAETQPVHRGRRMSVWQTQINREDGKPVALITQSQLYL